MNARLPSTTALNVMQGLNQSLKQELAPNTELYAGLQKAAQAVAPLWPLANFAARNPWQGWEHMPMLECARLLGNFTRLLPDLEEARHAARSGAISARALHTMARNWLYSQGWDQDQPDVLEFTLASLQGKVRGRRQTELRHWQELSARVEQGLHAGLLRVLPPQNLRVPPLMLPTQALQHALNAVEGTEQAMHVLALPDQHTIRICKLVLGAASAAWPVAGADLYQVWRSTIADEPDLPAELRAWWLALPEQADAALPVLLEADFYTHILGLDLRQESARMRLMQAHFLALPGWSGMLRQRRQERANGEQAIGSDDPLLQYMALRLALEAGIGDLLCRRFPACATLLRQHFKGGIIDSAALGKAISEWAKFGVHNASEWERQAPGWQAQRLHLALALDEAQQELLLQQAREWQYRMQLQSLLHAPRKAQSADGEQSTLHSASPSTARVHTQMVFCIDVRSEPMRRALEEQDSGIQTFGFAGFFGMAIRKRSLHEPLPHNACPVILKPGVEICELPAHGSEAEHQNLEQERRSATERKQLQQNLKQDTLGSLLLPEISAPLDGLQMLWHSVVPSRWRYALQQRKTAQVLSTFHPRSRLQLERKHAHDAEHGLPRGLSREEQADWAARSLRGIGLTRHFAPLVLIVGHGSHSTNNPYAAKLDCGACGGASGGFNARMLAQLCNSPQVRADLVAYGIQIPPHCQFLAFEHITSTDDLVCLTEPDFTHAASPATLRQQWDSLKQSMERACEQAQAIRLQNLAPTEKTRNAQQNRELAWRRSHDFSETRPEWGLAGNAAFLIARRSFSLGKDLQGRCFLQSYDWEQDQDGSLLGGIIAGPVTVGQWINLQYYASAIAPATQGSGSKATQSITSGLGVMQGNASDLQTGLPWQAVMRDDHTRYHEALRLLVVIEAPHAHVERMLRQQSDFAQKLKNGWILLSSFDPERGEWRDWGGA